MSSNIGSRVRRLRKAKGMGVNELARACYMDGGIVSRLENGKTKNMALVHLRRMAKVLGVTIDEIVIGPSPARGQGEL